MSRDTNRGENGTGAPSPRGVAGVCLAVCGALTIVWGVTAVPVSLTSPDFMSFVTGELVLVALGAHLVPQLPTTVLAVTVWLTAAALIGYLFVLPEVDLMIRLIGCVPVLGLAVRLTLRPLR